MIKFAPADFKYFINPIKLDPFSISLPNGQTSQQAIDIAAQDAARAIDHIVQAEEIRKSGKCFMMIEDHIDMLNMKRDYFLATLQKVHLCFGGDCFQRLINYYSELSLGKIGNKISGFLNELHASAETRLDEKGILTKMILSSKKEAPDIFYF